LVRLVAKEIAECLFNVNLSLFKGLFYFVLDTHTGDLMGRRELSGGGGLGSSRYPVQEERFMLFLKDDVRPFVLALLHTRSFKVPLLLLSSSHSPPSLILFLALPIQKLVLDIHLFKKHRPVAYQGGVLDESHISPTLSRFMTSAESRLAKRLQFYSTISTQRIGGYLTTFFADTTTPTSTSDSTQSSILHEQLFDFLYLFPYSADAMKRHIQQLKLSHPHHKSAFDQIKIKRRSSPSAHVSSPHPPSLGGVSWMPSG
jgi:hypothetical protein